MTQDLEKLQKIAISVADTLHGKVNMPQRVEKLKEEFNELLHEFPTTEYPHVDLFKVKDELGDVTLIITHIADHYGFSLFDLLHHAVNKSFQRLQDPTFMRLTQEARS